MVRGEAANLPGLLPIGLPRRFCKVNRLTNVWWLFIFTGFTGLFTTISTFIPGNSQFFETGAWRPALLKPGGDNGFGILPLLYGHEIINIHPFAA